jgi:hypothetical protein
MVWFLFAKLKQNSHSQYVTQQKEEKERINTKLGEDEGEKRKNSRVCLFV